LATRLKAEPLEVARTGLPVEKGWQDAVVQYLDDSIEKRTLGDDKVWFPLIRARPRTEMDAAFR
jgi:hypothetical protein